MTTRQDIEAMLDKIEAECEDPEMCWDWIFYTAMQNYHKAKKKEIIALEP